VIVLVSFDVGYSDYAWKVLKGSNNHVNYVPVGFESAVGEALGVWTSSSDALDKWVIVAAELDFPFGPDAAEDEEVMDEASN
jgi:hypothetical protein